MMIKSRLANCILIFIIPTNLYFYSQVTFSWHHEKPFNSRFDYRSVLRGALNNDPFVEIDLENDFMRVFPKGKYKQLLISELTKTAIDGIFIRSMTYDGENDKITIFIIPLGGSRSSAYMRKLDASPFFSKPKLKIAHYKDDLNLYIIEISVDFEQIKKYFNG